jgi:hypothetical protein
MNEEVQERPAEGEFEIYHYFNITPLILVVGVIFVIMRFR